MQLFAVGANCKVKGRGIETVSLWSDIKVVGY